MSLPCIGGRFHRLLALWRVDVEEVRGFGFAQGDGLLQFPLAELAVVVAGGAPRERFEGRQGSGVSRLAQGPYRVISLAERMLVGLHVGHQRGDVIAGMRMGRLGGRAPVVEARLNPPAKHAEGTAGHHEAYDQGREHGSAVSSLRMHVMSPVAVQITR